MFMANYRNIRRRNHPPILNQISVIYWPDLSRHCRQDHFAGIAEHYKIVLGLFFLMDKLDRKVMKMKILSVCFAVMTLLFTASCDDPAETDKIIKISIDYKFDGNRLIFYGESNLPSGTKMGVNFTEINLTESFSGSDAQGIEVFTDENGIFYGSTSQDFDIYIDDNGNFQSAGFSRQGDKVYGKYVFELFIYNNQNWQTSEVQRMLDNYEMNASTGIVPGKEVSFSNNMDFGMTEEQSADLLKRKNTIEEFTSIIQPQLQAETEALWERLNEMR
ncbi:MAG: hypothetical protein WD185_03880, partial [Sneathiella sp.]